MWSTLDKLFHRIPNSARYVIAIAALIALLPLYPSNATFKYRFSLGQTWLYDDLVATFDFPIQKTNQELGREKADLLTQMPPSYEVDLEVIKERKVQFEEAFATQLKLSRAAFPDVAKNTEGYEKYGARILEKLLERGVAKPDTFFEKRDKQFVINVLRGNETSKETLQNVNTPDKIKVWLDDSLPNSGLKEPEFLLPLLEPLLAPNMIFNPEKTEFYKQEEFEKIVSTRGMVASNELIIPKGGIITEQVFQKLMSYKKQYESDYLSSRKFYLVLIGYLLLSGLIFGVFLFYLRSHVPVIFERLRWLIFLFGWVLLYTYLMYGIKLGDVLHPYMVPFCIAPIIIKNFHSRELAFVTHLVSVLTAGLVTAPGYEFILLQLLVGLVVVFSGFDTRYWANFYQSILRIVFVYILAYIGIELIEVSNLQNVDWTVLIWLFLNGFLTLLAYPLIPLLGSAFGFTSSITLAELSDLGHPLLKELSINAPGTLQHSLQVANLAEAAAKEIEANDLLVKIGAMYHDIGKSLTPQYFIENQSGIANLHDDLPPLESARLILAHVTEGVKLAEKYALPKVLTRFIAMHHGTTHVEFFYRLHVQQNADGAADRAKFQYAGPKPKTREEAILMLADSLEAAAKSMKNPTVEGIDELVERIVNDKVRQAQLDDSALSFNELARCKESFKKTLKSIHHVRIEYPK